VGEQQRRPVAVNFVVDPDAVPIDPWHVSRLFMLVAVFASILARWVTWKKLPERDGTHVRRLLCCVQSLRRVPLSQRTTLSCRDNFERFQIAFASAPEPDHSCGQG
jgi:hypothetical protein